jgi:hypothetical protein
MAVTIYAQVNGSNIISNVIVVDESDAPNETAGIAFCKALFGDDTNWLLGDRGSEDYRKAGIGYTYDSSNNVFYPPTPYASWVLNTSTWIWESPVALPSDAGYDDADNPTEFVNYDWDESSTSWANRTVVTIPPPE